MIKTRTFLIIILLLLLISGGMSIFLYTYKPSGTIANIYSDGKCVYCVDLSLVTSPYTKSILTDDGKENTLLIEPGRICVSEADCPDLVCVKTGWISDGAAPIVCLPHRLVIRIEKESAANELSIDSVVK